MAIDVALTMPEENVSRVPFGPHPEDGHGHFLPAGAAVGDVEVALAVEDGVVHLVQARRERGGDADRRARLARRPPC